MRAVAFHGKHDVRVDDVDEPVMFAPTDAIVRVTTAAICGSDLHLYDRALPGMKTGDILGHEFVGVVEQLGSEVTHVSVGDRVVVPFVIACGHCYFCRRGLVALCDNTNPDAALIEPLYGHSPAGLFGYTHLFGGYPGGQAEYVRVPHADFGLFPLPDEVPDELAVLLADILPTGWAAAERCDIGPDDVVAIAGAGPVGQLAALSARSLGAREVVVIDRFEDRLELARGGAGVVAVNYRKQSPDRVLRELTEGRGPDVVIDAAGMEAHGGGILGVYDRVKQRMRLQTDRVTALRQLMRSVRKGGRVSIPGVYAAVADKFPIGTLFAKGLTMTGGQTNVHPLVEPLTRKLLDGSLDPSFVVTKTVSLDEAPDAYRRFLLKEPGYVKVLLKP